MSEAEEFNRIRRILFSTFHKGREGQENAFQYLEHYKKKISRRSYTGLKAELNFYKKYRKEFSLVLAADAGDHTDFSGVLGGESFRLDVTTNADYKQLKDYEPLQRDDEKYKIAIVSPEGDIEDLVDINFPFCPECEEGRLIDAAILLPENYNDHGECLWSNDQVLIGVCNVCQYFEEHDRISTGGLFDFNTELKNASDQYLIRLEKLDSTSKVTVFDERKLILQHSQDVLPYLNREFDKSLMALGGIAYITTDPRTADGYHCTRIHWRKDLKLLDEYVLDEYDIDLFHDE